MWLSVLRCNVHGVSVKKIKRMLDSYEHNVTVQSLFAMLAPTVVCGMQQALTAADSGSVDSVCDQSPSTDMSLLCINSSSSSSMGTSVTSLHNCIVQPLLVSTCTVPASSSGGVETGSLNCFISEAVASSCNDVTPCQSSRSPVGLSADNCKSVCCETLNSRPSTSIVESTLSGLVSDRSPVAIEREHVCSVGHLTCSAAETDIVGASIGVELENLPCTGAGVLCTQPPASTVLDPAYSTCTRQMSDVKLVSELSTCCQSQIVECLLTSYSEAKHDCQSADKTADNVDSRSCRDVASEWTHSDIERLTQLPDDGLLLAQPADVHNPLEATQAVASEGTDAGAELTDRHTSADLLSASRDDERLCEFATDQADSNVTVQTEPASLERDSEVIVQNTDRECYSGTRAAELIYWGQSDDSERLYSQSDEANIGAIADYTDDQHMPGVEPKPQRARLRSCQKKRISSVVKSILAAGKEWVSEHEDRWSSASASSETSPLDKELCCSDIDRCNAERRFVSNGRRCNSTQTEPYDFITLTRVGGDCEFTDTTNYLAVVETSPRDISQHASDGQLSPDVPVQVSLHKSCSTADDVENVDRCSQLDFLESCFPTISSRDLNELLSNCGNDVVVVSDLLLEFGYEYNEPHGDVTDLPSSSSSCTDSASCSPDRSAVVESSSSGTKLPTSRKNTSALYRLHRDSLISKGVELGSRKMRPHGRLQLHADVPSLTSEFHFTFTICCTSFVP